MHDWIEYEAMVFALGVDVVCPECSMGVLIRVDSDASERRVCDLCDLDFTVARSAIGSDGGQRWLVLR